MSFDVILGFDMETDIGSWTPFYEGLVHGTPRILELLEKHNVSGTFYFTGDAAEVNPKVLQAVAEAEHEVGCHSLYHETVGDELFPIPGVKPILPEETFFRIKKATEIVEGVLGGKVTSFRAPRLWGSTALVNALEELGYSTDASYPLYFYKERLVPYQPSKEDWTKEGNMKLLEIPNFADMTIESNDEYGRDRDQWPLFRTEGAERLLVHVDNMLEFYKKKELPATICLYLHPWEFHEMPEGLIHYGEGSVLPDPFITKNCGEVAVRELDKLIGELTKRGGVFRQAREIVD